MPDTFSDVQSLAPVFLVIFFGMVVLLADTGKSPARKRYIVVLSQIGLILAGFTAFSMLTIPSFAPSLNPPTIFGGGMVADRTGGIFCIVLCIIASFSVGMSTQALAERRINDGEYYALLLFATAGAMVMALSVDLVNLFVGLEILSVSLYILCGYLRRELRSEESSIKYFLLGAFGSGFFLYGIALIYGSVGLAAKAIGVDSPSYTGLNFIAEMLSRSSQIGTPLATSPVFVVGVALVFVGLAFKAAIVPFHWYAPDVYEGAPTGVTAFMSAGAKVGAFAGFLRLSQLLLHDSSNGAFRSMLWWMAVLTMVVGNAMAIRQRNIKRMLAYSSIAHAGYILVGIIASGDPNQGDLSISAVTYYLLTYTFMNLGAFAVIMWLGRDGGEYTDIRDYAGLAKRRPDAAAILSIFLLSLAGFPPVAGFFGKLYLFLGAVQSGETTLAAIGLIVSAIGVFYYLSVIAMMYFREPVQEFSDVRAGGARIVAYTAAILTLVSGLFWRLGAFSPTPAPTNPITVIPTGTPTAPASSPKSLPSAP